MLFVKFNCFAFCVYLRRTDQVDTLVSLAKLKELMDFLMNLQLGLLFIFDPLTSNENDSLTLSTPFKRTCQRHQCALVFIPELTLHNRMSFSVRIT